MEHKFPDIKTAFDFLSTLVLRDQSKWRTNKNKNGEGYNAHPKVRSKSHK